MWIKVVDRSNHATSMTELSKSKCKSRVYFAFLFYYWLMYTPAQFIIPQQMYWPCPYTGQALVFKLCVFVMIE